MHHHVISHPLCCTVTIDGIVILVSLLVKFCWPPMCGLVCGMFSIVTLVLPYWYVGTHGPLLVHMGACLGVIHIAWLITLLWRITITPLVAAQHNNTVQLIVLLLIMRASLPFICQLTRVTTRQRFSWVGVSASTPRLQTKNNSSLSINDHHHHGRHHHHHHHHLCCVDGELLWWSHVLQADANPCDKQICPNNESRFPNNMRQISDE